MSASSETASAASPAPDAGGHAASPAPGVAEATVLLPANLHARPAGALARAAATFRSSVRVEYAGRSVSPTGILAVMGLGATKGTSVTVRAEGEDAAEAVTALARVLAEAE
ncbi:HPr family phosphocarrier protein [Kitasatospora sp. NBC_00315]|uniref:HPr family phosphocarrier protein n=1 Tax=Kitasatospora sp. NBC_00315 TaxID=2975963 RepID=UPI0032569CA2